jgi:hypothetical protein
MINSESKARKRERDREKGGKERVRKYTIKIYAQHLFYFWAC